MHRKNDTPQRTTGGGGQKSGSNDRDRATGLSVQLVSDQQGRRSQGVAGPSWPGIDRGWGNGTFSLVMNPKTRLTVDSDESRIWSGFQRFSSEDKLTWLTTEGGTCHVNDTI